VKYVILIHSNPDPWGHPTIEYTPQGRAIPPERRAEMDKQFDALLAELHESGEWVIAEALGAPTSSTVYRWGSDGPLATDGPYAESKEQMGGFWIIEAPDMDAALDWASQGAAACEGPVEVRPLQDG